MVDEYLGKIIPNKVVIHPFISIQKEFGYSDITKGNERVGQIGKYFDDADLRLKTYEHIVKKYEKAFFQALFKIVVHERADRNEPLD